MNARLDQHPGREPGTAGGASALARQAFATARAGRLEEAGRLYDAALRLEPGNVDALQGAAMIALERGDGVRAEPLLVRALAADPARADLHYALGRLHRARGALQAAVDCYAEACRLQPDHAMAWVSLGNALRAQADYAKAIEAFQRAVSLAAPVPEAGLNLGLLLADSGRPDEARPHLSRALEWLRAEAPRQPQRADLQLSLGRALLATEGAAAAMPALERAFALAPERAGVAMMLARARIGAGDMEGAVRAMDAAPPLELADPASVMLLAQALNALGRHAAALEALRPALARHPRRIDLATELGHTCRLMDRMAEARDAFERALAIDPSSPDPHACLGELRSDVADFDGLLAHARDALALAPDSAVCLANVGVALQLLGRPQEALPWYEQALERDAGYHAARLWRGTALLSLGRLREGWEGFEARFDASEELSRALVTLPGRRWAGEPLRGTTLVVQAEQGLGDTLQFARFLPVLALQGARVILLCPRPLVRLMARMPGLVAALEVLPPGTPYDWHVPLMSVPHALGTTLDTIPATVPYLEADPAGVREWGERLGPRVGLRVGLAWAGEARKGSRLNLVTDRRRSLHLAQFSPLATVPGVQWYSLQKGEPAAEASHPPEGMALQDYSAEWTDLLDTAGFVGQLDLVISADTAPAHLAAALGKPVWLLSRSDACWRWMLGREDSPWYPGVRLFRQTRPMDWAPVVESVAEALGALAAPR